MIALRPPGATMIVANQPEEPHTSDPTPAAEASAPTSAAAPALTLVLLSNGRQINVGSAPEPVLIGRRDEARGILPGVDLGAEGGYEAGVSRQHAVLRLQDSSYYVEDLGSANGTFVNGQQLAPHAATAIAHGDELRCGVLRLRVEVQPA